MRGRRSALACLGGCLVVLALSSLEIYLRSFVAQDALGVCAWKLQYAQSNSALNCSMKYAWPYSTPTAWRYSLGYYLASSSAGFAMGFACTYVQYMLCPTGQIHGNLDLRRGHPATGSQLASSISVAAQSLPSPIG